MIYGKSIPYSKKLIYRKPHHRTTPAVRSYNLRNIFNSSIEGYLLYIFSIHLRWKIILFIFLNIIWHNIPYQNNFIRKNIIHITHLPLCFSFFFSCLNWNWYSASACFCFLLFILRSCLFCSCCSLSACCDFVPIPVLRNCFLLLFVSSLDSVLPP